MIVARAESIANSKPPEETFGLDNDISKTVANKIGEEFNFDCIKEKWNGNDTTLEIPPLEYYKSIHQVSLKELFFLVDCIVCKYYVKACV